MYDYITGRTAELNPAFIVVDNNGIGFMINISLNTYNDVVKVQKDDDVKLFVYEAIREDAWVLYGFISRSERSLFLLLLTVSGVGGNTARMVLSSFSVPEMVSIITEGNDRLLATVKGLGKKTAQKIILELKDKVSSDMRSLTQGSFPASAGQAAAGDQKSRDVAAALSVLGYNPSEINAVLSKIDITNLSVEEAIRQALKSSLR